MNTQAFKRRLTAVFSADVVGYSRMMGEDDVATVESIIAYRNVIATLIEQYSGRIVDSAGDNVLAEFASVVNAVQGAVAIQKELKARNAALSKNRRMWFRIGINVGDIIEEHDRIYGDGVNISARLEALADPGGVCISKTAFEHIESKLPLGYEYIGRQTVKNIVKPVEAYRVLMEPRILGVGDETTRSVTGVLNIRKLSLVAAIVIFGVLIGIGAGYFNLRSAPATFKSASVAMASVEKMAFPLPDKPSIAVLPFVNMSGDAKQEYLSDGFTEDLITTISKIPGLFVISRQSTYTYKGKPVNVKTVAEDLGVRYVLEGSIQKADNNIRINVQLIDALTGHHLWSERYVRKISAIFKLKDEIILKVSTELVVELTDGESARILARYTDNLEAWESYLLAIKHFRRYKKESIVRARDLFTKALGLDHQFLPALVGLAYTHWFDGRNAWNGSRQKSFEKAAALADRALAIDATGYSPNLLMSMICLMKREFEKAHTYLEKARSCAPGTNKFHAMQGLALNFLGEPHQAIRQFNIAMRLSPYYPDWYLSHLGLAYHLTGQYEKAILTLQKGIRRRPDAVEMHARLAAIYSDLGREQLAQSEASEVLRLKPDFSLERWANANPFKDMAMVQYRKDLLRKAGLK